jgi:hypothetical protein
VITIDENYMIDVDKYNYILVKNEHRLDKKGNEVFKTIGYYPSIECAIFACAEQYDRANLCNKNKTLYDAACIIRNTRDKFRKILKEILGDDSD